MEAIHYPESDDLRDLLRFAAEDGLIWLGERRMVLLHAGALSELRRELICSVGQEQARRILTRMGFASGMRDAELAREVTIASDNFWSTHSTRVTVLHLFWLAFLLELLSKISRVLPF